MEKSILLENLSFEDFVLRFGFDRDIIRSFIKCFHFYENDKGDVFGVFEDTFMNFNLFRIVDGYAFFYCGILNFTKDYFILFKLMDLSDIGFPVVYCGDLEPYHIYTFKGAKSNFMICFDGRKYKILIDL